MAVSKQNDYVDKVVSSLEEKTRGNQIGIYTLAGLGLAFAFHKVRPISKFSRARQVPKHIINSHEVLRGKIIDCELSANGPRLLFDHRPLVRIPFWHSSRPPLPVEIWGVKLVGGNGISWLQVVAVGKEASITPIKTTDDGLVAHVTVHWPEIIVDSPLARKKASNKQGFVEEVELGEKLIEYGMAKVSTDVPQRPQSPLSWWWLPWVKEKSFDHNRGYLLQRMQDKARMSREGFWQDLIPLTIFDKAFLFIKSYLPDKKFVKPKKVVSIAT